MPLTKFVKVGNISNLSDARYCAGMGVDMLGFSVIEGQNNFMSPRQFQEIRGWVTGPRIVAEMYGITSAETVNAVIEHYQPDYLELTLQEAHTIGKVSLPLIVSVDVSEVSQVKPLPSGNTVSHILVTGYRNDAELVTDIPLLLDLGTSPLEDIKLAGDFGIALNGSQEISPGLKNYDQLADVLEKLDAD